MDEENLKIEQTTECDKEPTPTTRDQLRLKEFIIKFEALPILWDSSASDYKNTRKRNAALNELLPFFRKIRSNATCDDVRKKINSLRSNYRKELKKIKHSRSVSGGIYKPKSWVFHMLKFFTKTEQPVLSTGETAYTKNEYEDATGHSSVSFSSIDLMNSSTLLKRQIGRLSKQNELLEKACTFLTQSVHKSPESNNTLNVTALYWTEKLNDLATKQKLLAEKYINEILFEAEMGNLERDSVQIKSHSRSGNVIISTPSQSSNQSL